MANGDDFWVLPVEAMEGVSAADPDYVFARARQIWLEGGKECGDEKIDEVLAYFRETRETRGSEEEVWYVPKFFENLHRANILFQHPRNRTRVLLECSILARASTAEISEFLGVSDAVISSYEDVFFNVRGQLDNPGFVLTKVIPAGIMQLNHSCGADNLEEIDVSIADILRKFAYMLGWEELRHFLTTGGFSDKARRYFWSEFDKSEYAKAVLASLLEVADGKGRGEIIGRRARGREKEQEMKQGLDEQEWLSELSDLNKQFNFRAIQPEERTLEATEPCRLFLKAGESNDEAAER